MNGVLPVGDLALSSPTCCCPPNVSCGQTMNDADRSAEGYLAIPDGSWCEIAEHADEHGNRPVYEADS